MDCFQCPHCSLKLPKSSFFANAGRKDGRSVLCKTCFRQYESSPERRAKRTWNTIKFRSGRQKGYEHVRVEMTRDEFIGFAVPAYTEWMSEHPGLCPSIDRIDSEGPYSLANIRVIERGENSRLQKRHKNVFAPPGMAWCHACKKYLDQSLFWKSAGSFNGLQHRCKQCQTDTINRSRNS